MPIKPQNKHLYAPNWKTEIRPAILKRAENRCEYCKVKNGSHEPRVKKSYRGYECIRDVKIVLTIAHLDHDPTNNDFKNLKALCQLCHNRYDARAKSRYKTLEDKKGPLLI